MLKGYLYAGPLPLGSVVAHNCGGAGLFRDKDNPQVLLRGTEQGDMYTLTVTAEGETHTIVGPVSPGGRRRMGQELLVLLRGLQGMERYNEWGTLIGVRPMKLLHKYTDRFGTVDAATRHIGDEFSVSAEKLALLGVIGGIQRPYLESVDDRSVSVYCGIPFCDTRCVYCSFPYGIYRDYAHQREFLGALVRDMEDVIRVKAMYELDVRSLYMGGGTPTVLGDDDFDSVLSVWAGLVADGREFTVEAGRPDSVTPHKLRVMERLGVTRISINPQSMQDRILRRIGRAHSREDIQTLFRYVKDHTSLAVNMDFIAGLPGQTADDMVENMDYVCSELPDNVTIHTLALKRGSLLYEEGATRDIPGEGDVRYMVAYARERLTKAGYVPYYLYRQQYMTGQLENIGYMLPGQACEYNIQAMEERQTILSAGPGGSSKWMRYPGFRQRKQYMPKDADVYYKTIQTLLDKRHALCKSFWEVV